MSVILSNKVFQFREQMLLSALKLEIQGLRKSKGPSVYSIIKREYKLLGNRQSVYDQFKALLESREEVSTG